MAAIEARPPLQPGESAPDFTLPTVEGEATVSLGDYRGKSPLLLTLFRGVYCPFCRRSIAKMGITRDKLQAMGVEVLGVVTTKPEHARLYFRYHPTSLRLAADPELTTHRSYGLPKPEVTPELMQAVQTVRINPTGELKEPLPIPAVAEALDKLDRFEQTEPHRQEKERVFPQLEGQFLLDRDAIVRWPNIECAKEGLAGVGKFPTEEELMSAAQTLSK